MTQEPTIKSLLREVERAGRRLERLLQALDEALRKAEARGETTAAIRDLALGPELPNGEGTVDQRTEVCRCGHVAMIHHHLVGMCQAQVGCPCEGFTSSGLTESEILQGREAPPGCDPVAPGEGAGYHSGSNADPRD
jgi:hypothetical protein